MRLHFLLTTLTLTLLFKLNAQQQNISNGNVFEGEPFIAVNPANPQQIAVAWMGFVPGNNLRLSIKLRSSFDGGASWKPIVVIPHIQPTYKSADPSLAFDNNGNLYLSFIDYQENPYLGGVYLFKSTDGGLSWGNPVQMIGMAADGSKYPIDRPWLSISETGEQLYLTTKPAPWIPAPNRPYFTQSGDGGQTWSQWRYLDGSGNLVGNFIQAPMAAPAATGNRFFAAYPSYVPGQNLLPQYILASSADAGASFQYKSILVATSNGTANDSAKLAYKLLVDPSDTQHLAFIYPYQPAGDFDIMMTETYNAGTTWTAPLRMNDDPLGNGKMQDMVWADFDDNGALLIAWRDRRNAPGTGYATASEFYAAYRPKGSPNFKSNFQLSETPVAYHNILSQSGNDFMGIELSRDTISAVWGNTRDGSLDIWFVRMAALSGQASAVAQLEGATAALNIYPIPSAGVFNVAMNTEESINALYLFDAQGREIMRVFPNSQTTSIDLSRFPAGRYMVRIESNDRVYSRILLR